VPLSKLQSEILRLLAAHRDPESYVGGSTPLTRIAPRYSGDIVFSMIVRSGSTVLSSKTLPF
jgi:hypothetical protein